MSREIDLGNRVPFFPTNKSSQNVKPDRTNDIALKRNGRERMSQLRDSTAGDAKVEISDSIKDFSRIKKAVDAAPDIDNSEKIANLRSKIQRGEYTIDYDALADRMLSTEL